VIQQDDDAELYVGLEPEVTLDISFNNVIIVDGLPVVTEEKYEKLVVVVRKIFQQIGRIKENGLYMPLDNTVNPKTSKGIAFIEFETAEEAEHAVQQTNGYSLDKQHRFKVNFYSDLEKISNIKEEYTPPEIPEYQPREDLHDWLLDKSARDQFVVRWGDETEIYINDLYPKPEQIYSRTRWTDNNNFVSWSPRGTYLATYHQQGIALWGGAKWSKQMRLAHLNVKLIEFSPKEKYLVTWNSLQNDDPRDPKGIIIWEVRSGKKLRSFVAYQKDQWPIFKWSADDKYFARLNLDNGSIDVYESATMKKLGGDSLKIEGTTIEGARDFCWSPTDNIISFWVPERGNNPTKVSLISIPAMKEIRKKSSFQCGR